MGNRVAITSANTAHYIAFEDGHPSEWRWTRDFGSAYRFENQAAAEHFASTYLADMGSAVWYLRNLW